MVDLAAIDVARLRTAKSCRAARAAWVEFLEHSNRAINRLEGHSKRTNQLPLYKKLIKDDIWENNLTKYMRIARNYHEHGIEELDIDDPYNERIVLPDGQILGSSIALGITEAGDEVTMPTSGPREYSLGPGMRVIKLKPTVQMVSVRDHQGNIVRPPHIGALLEEDEPAIAAAARSYLDWVVSKIATFA